MPKTYAKPHIEWDGFEPVPYHLSDKALDLAITLRREGGVMQESVTVGNLLKELREVPIQETVRAFGGAAISTERGKLHLDGPSFNCDIVLSFLDLQKDGINAFEASWFWYAKDHATADVMERYQFFVVANDAIVRQDLSFADYSESGFDPTVFQPPDRGDPIWYSFPRWDEAWTRHWYRRFYQETKVGQLMVLRPDAPVLHYYSEARVSQAIVSVSLLDLLRQLRIPLWIAVVLLAVIAYRLVFR